MSILFSAWTVLVAVFFVGIVIWVLRADKTEFDEAANIPFEEDEFLSLEEEKEENKHG
jgi:cbb3-type cytochrome oxidase subunit 3